MELADQHLIIFGIVLLSLILFLSERIPADIVALAVAVTLGLLPLGNPILTPEQAFSGFSRSAVITIIAIFILADALQRTGVTEKVGSALLKVGGASETRLIVAVMAAGAFLSLFMNNIAAAAVLLPPVSGAARKSGVNISKLMLPLAFATSLGGMATLLTTANIVINAVMSDQGIEVFRLTDFAPVGIPVTIAGICFFVLFGKRLLPGESGIDRTQAPDKGDLVQTYHLGENLFRARVPDDSILIGRTLSSSTLRETYGVSVVAIERGDQKLLSLSPDTKILFGDTLVLEGSESKFREQDTQPYMEILPAPEWTEDYLESRTVEVVEAMLAPRSRLIGSTLRETRFRDKYGMNVLAVWRADQEIVVGIADLKLEFGDALLLQGPKDRLPVLAVDSDLILLMPKEQFQLPAKPGKGRIALSIFSAALLISIFVPHIIGPVMLGAAILMVLTRVVSSEQAYGAIGWKSVILIAGMLPLGIALAKPFGPSGMTAAGILGGGVMSVFGTFGVAGLVVGICFLTVMLVQVINSGVIAAVMSPIAISLAIQEGIDPRALLMGIAVCCSMPFATPLGHPVNLLIMGPGGYSFRDFARIGIPLAILSFITAMIFLPIFWRF